LPSKKEEAFFNADLVLVSPLCRAFQTAVVALDGHPTVQRQGVKLLRSIREIKKSSAGNDCVANACGEDICTRVVRKLAQVTGTDIPSRPFYTPDVSYYSHAIHRTP
jgi:hypothetical protein